MSKSKVLGGGVDEKDEALEKLVNKMTEMIERDFSSSRLVEFINDRQEHEDAIPRYYQFVEGLNINDKGKKALYSIVEKKRSGKMEFLLDGESLTEFEIKKTDESRESLAEELILVVGKIMELIPQDKKIDFMFSED